VAAGAGEGNRTLVFSLEGCRVLNAFNAYSDKMRQLLALVLKRDLILPERHGGKP
jgi:hypothetical protein